MKTNPGGYIDPAQALGREEVITELWAILETQSVYMNAERRIGKTTVLRKLESTPRAQFVPIQRDLESIHTAVEFAAATYKDIDAFLTSRKRVKRRLQEFVNGMGGSELGGVFKLPNNQPVPWKQVLEKSIEDLSESFADDGFRLLFLWDEFPFMLANIARRENENTAMEVLDTLRHLRQTHPALRMLLTGSIGLHHVISALKTKRYANAPINDMAPFEIEPLTPAYGSELALKLLAGEGFAGESLASSSELVSATVDHFPFYIHHMVRALKRRAAAPTAAAIEAALSAVLFDANDPWELRHYRDRLRTYYEADESIALAILDAAATADALSLEMAFNAVVSQVPLSDKEHLRDVLNALQRDHYLTRTATGYAFKFSLIKRWWKVNRDL